MIDVSNETILTFFLGSSAGKIKSVVHDTVVGWLSFESGNVLVRYQTTMFLTTLWLVFATTSAQETDAPRLESNASARHMTQVEERRTAKFQFEMDDSSRIIGVPDIEYLDFDLGYAQVNLPLAKIRKVTSRRTIVANDQVPMAEDDPFAATVLPLTPSEHDQFVVEMRNKDRFTGRILNESCQVDFIAGRLTLPFDQMNAFGVRGASFDLPGTKMNGLIAHFSFDQIDGSMTKNVADNKHHCLHGNTPLVRGGKGKGQGGKLARFSGATRMTLAHHPALCPAKITLSAWIKPKAGHRTGYAFIAGKTNASTWEGGYAFIYMHNDPTSIYFYVNGYQKQVVKIQVADDKWTHLTGTYDGEFIKLYKNGLEVAKSPGSNSPISHTATPFTIGSDPSAYHWHGDLDEVMVFNDAVTKSDVKLIYAKSKR